MLEELRKQFAAAANITIVAHDLTNRAPRTGHVRRRRLELCHPSRLSRAQASLYAEVFTRLNPGGVFLNLEHVASPTPSLHESFLATMDLTPETEDPSNKLLDLEIQLLAPRNRLFGSRLPLEMARTRATRWHQSTPVILKRSDKDR